VSFLLFLRKLSFLCLALMERRSCSGDDTDGGDRKKQQQAAARKQVMDARKRGEDVDGRGTTGPSGRQPRAETE
jgi:hypothetical protein